MTADEQFTGFPPVLGTSPNILILGTMPSVASKRRAQYYGHSRNLFWTFMGKLLGAAPELDYQERVGILKHRKVALWDVACRCDRQLSSDASIQNVVPNEIADLLSRRQTIRAVFFNGRKAEELFDKYLAGELSPSVRQRLHFETLPSTSPANASVRRQTKARRWRNILEWL